MKIFDNRFSLAVNLWVFLIFGSGLVRLIGGFFSSYLDAPIILLISIIYTLITAIMTWQSTLRKKETDPNKYDWKIIAAQMISLLHFFGGIYIFLTMFLTSLGFELSYKQSNTIHEYIFFADFIVFGYIMIKFVPTKTTLLGLLILIASHGYFLNNLGLGKSVDLSVAYSNPITVIGVIILSIGVILESNKKR